jgi:hypothetical protein
MRFKPELTKTEGPASRIIGAVGRNPAAGFGRAANSLQQLIGGVKDEMTLSPEVPLRGQVSLHRLDSLRRFPVNPDFPQSRTAPA